MYTHPAGAGGTVSFYSERALLAGGVDDIVSTLYDVFHPQFRTHELTAFTPCTRPICFSKREGDQYQSLNPASYRDPFGVVMLPFKDTRSTRFGVSYTDFAMVPVSVTMQTVKRPHNNRLRGAVTNINVELPRYDPRYITPLDAFILEEIKREVDTHKLHYTEKGRAYSDYTSPDTGTALGTVEVRGFVVINLTAPNHLDARWLCSRLFNWSIGYGDIPVREDTITELLKSMTEDANLITERASVEGDTGFSRIVYVGENFGGQLYVVDGENMQRCVTPIPSNVEVPAEMLDTLKTGLTTKDCAVIKIIDRRAQDGSALGPLDYTFYLDNKGNFLGKPTTSQKNVLKQYGVCLSQEEALKTRESNRTRSFKEATGTWWGKILVGLEKTFDKHVTKSGMVAALSVAALIYKTIVEPLITKKGIAAGFASGLFGFILEGALLHLAIKGMVIVIKFTCKRIVRRVVKRVKKVAHAVASTCKRMWSGICSLFRSKSTQVA